VEKRIRDVGAAMKGSLVHWDVVNEPYDNHDLQDLLGEEILVDWFKRARTVDPKAKLFLNDYGILPGGGADNGHRQHFEKTISFLLENKAPLDAIGIQGHFGTSITSPTDLLAQLDRYGRFGKPIWITEYDLLVEDEALAADYTRDFYTVLFSHPAVEGVVMWGFYDDLHWKKNAVMYRKDWSLKPAGKVYQDLFGAKWHTRVTLPSDAKGTAAVRGFMGRYRVTASAEGKQGQATGELDKRGTKIIVSIP
jgi:GH35 family endo-1,4-beta-xylanase